MKITVDEVRPAIKGEEDWIYWLITERRDYIKVQIGFNASEEDAKEIIRRITQEEPS